MNSSRVRYFHHANEYVANSVIFDLKMYIHEKFYFGILATQEIKRRITNKINGETTHKQQINFE